MRTLRIAFGLMTTLPFKLPDDWSAGDSGRAAGWYPFVGAVIGALTWLAWAGARLFFHPLAASGLTLAVWVLLTGGLHLDGLADCFDGMFHASNPERRLQIMKDSHVGAFGVIGLILILLIKFSALASLSPARAFGAILLSASLARWCVILAGTQPLARPDGMGADFASGLKKSALVFGGIIPLALAIWFGLAGALSIVLSLLAAVIILRLARRNLGGVTGDVFGMVIEIVETVVLLAFSIGA